MNASEIINICVIKPITTSYPSVFDDAANCFSKTLKNIGIRNIISYNNIDPNIVNVVFGAGTHNTAPISQIKKIAKPDKTIIFNLEQTGSTSDLISSEYISLLTEYITFDYNESNIQKISENTPNRAASFEFPIAPHLELKTNLTTPESIRINFDYAFYGALNQDREEKISRLREMGLRIKIIKQAYGEYLTDAIIDCKAVLNIHYYGTHIFEAARALRPTAIGIPVISERSVLPKTVNWESSGVFFPNEDFFTAATNLIQDHEKLLELSRRSLYFTKKEGWLPIAADVFEKSLIELKNL